MIFRPPTRRILFRLMLNSILLAELPAPEPSAQAHSKKLQTLIHARIQEQGGKVSFAEFMQLALYAPGLGYYSAGLQKFGSEGDFITAPEISSLFSQALANQCAEILANLSHSNIYGNVLEFGAGTGSMAAEILLQLERLQQLPQHYYILELSADLRERQHTTLKSQCPHLLPLVRWLDTLSGPPFTGIVLANEVLDAMPVERYRKTAEGFDRAYVQCVQDEFKIVYQPVILTPELKTLQKMHSDLPVGYEFELNHYLAPWLQSLSDYLAQGVAILIDYGYSEREYFDAARVGGTLRCYYRHHAHEEPLHWPGLQDITAHVNFTAAAEAAYSAGLSILGYTTQAAFLLGNGILNLPEQNNPKIKFNQQQQRKQLLLPHEMGETFKVLVLGKNYELPLTGLSLNLREKL
jgi:SAM-dependent MidA family methyltransferase